MRKAWHILFVAAVALPLSCTSGTSSTEKDPDVSGCALGYFACSGVCRDLQGDGQNCGTCGNSCASGQVCSAGTCQQSCTEPGRTPCDTSCIDLQTNPEHCGGCELTCTAEQTCQSGTCVDGAEPGSGGGTGSGGTSGSYSTEVVLEEGELGQCNVDGVVESTHGGFSGIGYLNSDNAVGAGIEWAVDIGEAGIYSLEFTYANESAADRAAEVLVGGVVAAAGIAFASTSSWATWSTSSVDVTLAAGENRIVLRATSDLGLANIDRLTVSGAAVSALDCDGNVGSGGSTSTGGSTGSGGESGGGLADQYPCDGSTAGYDYVVTGSGSNYRVNTTEHPSLVSAIRAALGNGGTNSSNMRTVLVQDGGNVPDEQIRVYSNTLINICGELNVTGPAGTGDRSPLYARDASNIVVPHISVRGAAPYGTFFRNVDNVHIGEADIRISGGLGMRFDNNPSGNSWANSASNAARRTGLQLDSAFVQTVSHGVELYGIDGVTIGTVVARNTTQAGLMLNNSRNVEVGLVDGQYVAPGSGYAVFRMANDNGKDWNNGSHPMSIHVGKVVARESGGANGLGIFCLTDSGGVTIDEIDLENTASSSIWLEWCTNVKIGNASKQSRIHNSGGVLLSYGTSNRYSNNLIFENIAITGTTINATHPTCPPSLQWINVTLNGNPVTLCQ